ncbi:MAG TPA: hypothetical protein VHO46_11400 [Bacteroidales bacterium]|nr:hypothetical protein [Bacteroidales bacterium]
MPEMSGGFRQRLKKVFLFSGGLIITLITTICIFSTSCDNTGGQLEITGKVTDRVTGEKIPLKHVIVQAVEYIDKKRVFVETGHFSADSSGAFSFIMKKLKNVYRYNFCFVGDTNYAYETREMSLIELTSNSKYLNFQLDRLTNLTIVINRKSTSPAYDTLSLFWESNGISGWKLYTYRIDNYGESGTEVKLNTGRELRWIGGNVNSSVYTKVYAGKRTRLRWDLDRNGRRQDYTDTITCKRDMPNFVYFTY